MSNFSEDLMCLNKRIESYESALAQANLRKVPYELGVVLGVLKTYLPIASSLAGKIPADA